MKKILIISLLFISSIGMSQTMQFSSISVTSRLRKDTTWTEWTSFAETYVNVVVSLETELYVSISSIVPQYYNIMRVNKCGRTATHAIFSFICIDDNSIQNQVDLIFPDDKTKPPLLYIMYNNIEWAYELNLTKILN